MEGLDPPALPLKTPLTREERRLKRQADARSNAKGISAGPPRCMNCVCHCEAESCKNLQCLISQAQELSTILAVRAISIGNGAGLFIRPRCQLANGSNIIPNDLTR
jgi:hypothetical protein